MTTSGIEPMNCQAVNDSTSSTVWRLFITLRSTDVAAQQKFLPPAKSC